MGRMEPAGVDIRRLRYFMAVCDHGGLSRAASVIGIAQPALTRQVKLLEQELGVELFKRNGRGALPNDAGLFLMGAARKYIEELDVVVDRLRRDYGSGPLRISLGICPTITPLFLNHIDEAVRTSSGALELNFIEAYSGDLKNLMSAGRLDIALTYSSPETQGLRTTNLLTEKLVLASQAMPEKATLTLSDLSGMKLILPSRMHQLRRIVDAVSRDRQCPLMPALELDSLSTVKALVGDGTREFSTILPFHSVAHDAEEGRFQTQIIDEPGMVRTIALLRPDTIAGNIPTDMADRIINRAEDIKKTMEAVY